MKFATSRESLIRVLSVAREIISNNSPLSILSNVLLQTDKDNSRIVIKCTNSNINAVSYFNAEIEEEGETTVFCDKMLSVISSLPSGNVVFENKGTEINIKPENKKIKFKIKTLSADKFPVIKDFNKDNVFEISAKEFKNLIRQTSFAVATDPNRYFMTGCYLTKDNGRLTMVATDAKRMSLCSSSSECPDFTPVIIPVKMLSIIDKIASDEGNILLSIHEREFHFSGNGYEIYCTLIDGKYPAYQKVLPTGLDKSIKVSKAELSDSLKRTSVLLSKNGRINLIADAGKMVISSPESELGNSVEEIPAVYDGEKAEIALNVEFLLDVLKVIDSNDIIFEFKFNQDKKVLAAIVVKGDDKKEVNYTHIIMPMN